MKHANDFALKKKSETEFIRYALDCAAIVAITDVRGTITFVNSRFCLISGYSKKELIGANHRMLHSGVHDTGFFRSMYRDIAQGRNWHGEICNRRKDGTLYWVDTTIVPHLSAEGKVDGYTSIRFDITPRKQAEGALRASRERLREIVNLDPLTGLPNRRRFQEFMEIEVSAPNSERSGALGLLDIDQFKDINDTFGHDAGDKLLAVIAQRLSALENDRIFVARIGGDEFGLILSDVDQNEVDTFFESVLECIREPIDIGSTLRRCSASLGIAAYPQDASDAESLLKLADIALYHAKSLGRDRAELFQPHLKEAIDHRSSILTEIEDGLRDGQFHMYYQPIVPDAADLPVSLEALMRWDHPQRGIVGPNAFAVGFEDPSVRAALGMFMLERVFADVADMVASAMLFRRIAINLTNSDFRSDEFLDRFFQLSQETGISPGRFCVEVTEGMFLGRDQVRVEQGLQRLHRAGVEIALDDFGTGFASLTHLRQLPVDRLKIDRSFVANISTSQEDQAIVKGVIEIAHSLGKVVTAEGVETDDQVRLLSNMGCDHFQGWYFSKAIEASKLAVVVGDIRSRKRVRLATASA